VRISIHTKFRLSYSHHGTLRMLLKQFAKVQLNKSIQLTILRPYAQIAHTRPLIVHRYDEYVYLLCILCLIVRPPRSIVAETRSLLETGRRRCLKMRKPYGSKKRIPGLLMFPDKDPVYLSLNPAQIKTFLTYDHFLGKRYMLV
jgi:hypothetical protein